MRKPTRVLVNKDGLAVPPSRNPSLEPISVVFVRKDGWSIGAPAGLEWAAYALWAAEWVSFERADCVSHSILDYKGPGR
jgi:hypothetical protein